MPFFRKTLPKLLLRFIVWCLKAIGAVLALYLVLIALGFFLFRQYAPQLPEQGILVIDVEQGWVEAPAPRSPLFDFLPLGQALPGAEMPHSLLQAVEALHRARTDPKITGLLVTGDFSRAPVNRIGLAGVLELGAAVRAFGEAKPTYAYLKNPGLPDLLLAAHCRERMIAPQGEAFFPGLAAESLFFAEAFERIGIGIQTARMGSHKSAVEPFTRTGFSPEAKAQQERLVGALWDSLLTHLVAATGLERALFEGWAADRGFVGPEVVARGGFAEPLDYADLLERLVETAGSDPRVPETFSQINLPAYLGTAPRGTPEEARNVAVVFVEGLIADEDSPGIVDGERVARQIREARKSGDYDALLLRVNSPGGAVYPSRVVADALRRARERMPVYVSMGQYAASGGYWIAAPADHIAAGPLTLTGSIGVYALLPNIEATIDKLGLHVERSRSGPLADMQSLTRTRSPEQMQALRSRVATTYQIFLSVVGDNRSIPPGRLASVAEGRVWTGEEALQRNLVDGAQGYATLRSTLQEAFGGAPLAFEWLAAESPGLLRGAFTWLGGRGGLREILLPEARAMERLLPEASRAAVRDLHALSRYHGPVSYCPIRLVP